MKTVSYITTNEEKFRSASTILKEFGIDVVQAAIATPEIQAASARDVAAHSAEYGSTVLGKPVIKKDVEFCIDALHGLPGPYIKYFNERVTPEVVLKLMRGETNRRARFNDAICFFDAAKNISQCFEFPTAGTIGEEVRGSNGWGIDQVFVPHGSTTTLAEMSDSARLEVWKGGAWKSLAEYLLTVL